MHGHHRHRLCPGGGAGGLHGHPEGRLRPGLHHDDRRGGPDRAGDPLPPGGGPAPGPLQHGGVHEVPPDAAPLRQLGPGPYLHHPHDQLRHLGPAPDGPQVLRHQRPAGGKARRGDLHLLLPAGGGRRVLYRLPFPPVLRGDHARRGQGLPGPPDAGPGGAAQPAHRGDPGAAHLRLGVHPVQHHPHRLLHRGHGPGESPAPAQDGGPEHGGPHPGAVFGLCGAQLLYRQLPHPHPGDDVLLLGDSLRVLPGAVPIAAVLEGREQSGGLGWDDRGLSHGLCAGGGLGLYHAQRPTVRLSCHGAVLPAVRGGEQTGLRQRLGQRPAQRRLLPERRLTAGAKEAKNFYFSPPHAKKESPNLGSPIFCAGRFRTRRWSGLPPPGCGGRCWPRPWGRRRGRQPPLPCGGCHASSGTSRQPGGTGRKKARPPRSGPGPSPLETAHSSWQKKENTQH